MRPIFAALVALSFNAVATSAQQVPAPGYQIHKDVVRGRVTGDSGKVIVGADVAITMAPDRTTEFAKSDSAGHYEVTFPRGTGDYLVHVAALGREAFRKRVTRTGSDSLFTVDAVLKPSVQQLAPVTVQANRTRIARDNGGGFPNPVGGREQNVSNQVNSAVPADQRSSLDAMASTVPGISAVAGGGVSVLGLAPGQNNTTLNGLSFDGANVPRGATTATSVASSTYDPSRGGFSGAQTSISLQPGDINLRRRAYFTLDAPAMQAVDAVGSHAGQQYTALDLNLGTSGATNMDRWVYNGGLELKRQFSDITSIVDADPDVLTHAGLARDSVSRLLSALGALGIPTSSRGIPSTRATDVVNFMGRLDRPLFDYNTFTPLNTTWGITAFANRSHTGALTFSPTSTPAHSGETTDLSTGVQAIYSSYFGAKKDELNDTKTGVSVRRVQTSPYVALPDGRVLVASTLSDSRGGVASVGFAGNATLDAERTTYTWETTNDTYFYWKGLAPHRGRVSLDARLSGYSIDNSSNRLGTYSYNSLADLEANRPASFTRTLNSPTRTGGEWYGAASVSDSWTQSSHLSMIYGLRFEGNAFTKSPIANPDIERTFGVANSNAPISIGVSPRVGFNWYYTSQRPLFGLSANPNGVFYTVPKGVIRGGIGEFQQTLDPTLLSDATVLTGLPGAVRRLSCFGPAVPNADWQTFDSNQAAIPTTCAGSATTFSDVAPSVQLFDPSYRAPRSWRGNLSWSSSFKGVAYVIDGIYALHLNQPSVTDLNFSSTPRFALPDEADRPVFVPMSSIVATSGVVSPTAARVSSQYGSVLSRSSDLHGSAKQASVRVRPNLQFVGRWVIDGTYTYTDARMQTRGFDASTFLDPRTVTMARADYASRHEVTLTAAYSMPWFAVSLYGKASSGLPFTPMVGSDINGDGLANDRAFVFDAGKTGNAALSNGIRSLIATTSSRSRDCLLAQVGSAAARNSCEGPWTAAFNMSLSPGYYITRKLPFSSHQPQFTVYIANPLGGLDQLLHGSNLKGWGTPSYPDAILYYVRGFDSTAKRYQYDVNPRFGNTRPTATTFRTPFRVTLDFSMNFGPTNDEQQVERMLRNGRRGNPGARLDSAAIVKRYCGNLPDWYNDIISQADSLLLSRDQVDSLRAHRAAYLAKVREHWGRFAGQLAAIGDSYDLAELVKRQVAVTDEAWDIARDDAQTNLPKILTPAQLKILPGNSSFVFNSKDPIRGVRYFSTSLC